MLILALRTVVLYTVVLIAIRIMGKREIGQLQPFEFVMAIIMSDLVVGPLDNTSIPLVHGIVPILALLIAYLVISYATLKSDLIRHIVCGRPTILILRGEIQQDKMRSLRYNLGDLFEQLRSKDIFSLSDVEYAILETSGSLSIIPRADVRGLTPRDMGLAPEGESPPYHLILDGKLDHQTLGESGHTTQWLNATLKEYGVSDIRDVFYAGLDSDGFVLQIKKPSKWRNHI